MKEQMTSPFNIMAIVATVVFLLGSTVAFKNLGITFWGLYAVCLLGIGVVFLLFIGMVLSGAFNKFKGI